MTTYELTVLAIVILFIIVGVLIFSKPSPVKPHPLYEAQQGVKESQELILSRKAEFEVQIKNAELELAEQIEKGKLKLIVKTKSGEVFEEIIKGSGWIDKYTTANYKNFYATVIFNDSQSIANGRIYFNQYDFFQIGNNHIARQDIAQITVEEIKE